MILEVIIGFLAIIIPGFFLALALLRRTGMNWFLLVVFGFIFGLIFPPTMIWAEAYLIPYIHGFSFSAGLYNANVVILTIIGLALSFQQGALSIGEIRGWLRFGRKNSTFSSSAANADYRVRISELRGKISHLSADMKVVREHQREENELAQHHAHELQTLKDSHAGAEETDGVRRSHAEQERRLYEEHEREEHALLSKEDARPSSRMPFVWGALLVLMLLAFASRIVNLGVAPKFFEFDPYFDMISTQYILTYGYQLTYSHSAWPTLVNGTIQSIQPIVPYIEAYWYQIANHAPASAQLNTTLLSTVGSVYPPIVAALLVFVVFVFLFYEYGEFPALIGAGLAATVPTLISTFIAGEQLVEPWGIFALFFFFAAYLLAVKNPDEKRFAILAGIAFAATFLGSHYYTVDAGILAIYILLQGLLDVLRNKSNVSFYKMNAIVIGVIVLFYALYGPYTTAITNSIPSVVGIPTIIAFPLFALLMVAAFEYVPVLAKRYGVLKKIERMTYYLWFAALVILVVLLILFTPLGKPIRSYYELSIHFTTPSIPLFMTVQEYAITGLTFNFASGGFGIIGSSVAGIPLFIYGVLAIFTALSLYNIAKRDSKLSILSLSVVLVLAAAGFSEVKYLPHFAVAYILALCIIFGEAALLLKDNMTDSSNATMTGVAIFLLVLVLVTMVLQHALYESVIAFLTILAVAYMYTRMSKESSVMYNTYLLYAAGGFIVLISAGSLVNVFSAAANPNCTTLSAINSTNELGLNLFCNQVSPAWLAAMNWTSQHVGPYAPRILSWWDYGDWINWFGNSNAVIRGDNAVASYDYKIAAQYVLGLNDSYDPANLSRFMDSAQAGYVLFDDQLVPKWSALDFLACININQTSQAYATAQGQQYGQPFLIGTSQCEITHDPVDINIPASPAITDYCSFSNSSVTAVKSILTVGESVPQLVNQTLCVSTTPDKNNVLRVYYTNGTKSNVIVSATQEFYLGGRQFTQGGGTYLSFMALYLPNGPDYTVTDAPTDFYNSNFYRGFFIGHLTGFTLVYPTAFNGNFVGINFVNTTNDVMIFHLNNYSGGNPTVVPKPSWVSNNYSLPG